MSGTDYTLTTNLGLYKPIPEADVDTWGGHLNANADTLDTTIHGIQYVTATGSTAPRSLQDRFAERLNVKDFYTGNWDTAFDAAFTALPTTGGTILVPAGTYAWAATHVWSNKAVSLIGDGKGVSQIYVQHTGTALTINQTGSGAIFNRINISGLSFFAQASAGPTQGAIAINYPAGGSFPASFAYETVTASHVEINTITSSTGPTWANSFLTGITLTGTWCAKLDDIHFFGAPVSPALSGSYAIGIAQSEDTRISKLYAQYAQAAISILNHGEGIEVDNSTFVGTDYAISVAAGATVGANPNVLWNLITASNCEMNCYLGILSLRNVQNCTVTNCDMTRFGDSGASNWTVVALTDCQWCTVANNWVSGSGAVQATNRYVVMISVSWGCLHNNIDNQVVPNQMGTFTTFSGSPDPTLYNRVTWTQGGATYATQPIQIGNGTTLRFNDTGQTSGLRLVVGSDNHFGIYSSDGSGGTAQVVDFYVHTPTPTWNFNLPVKFGNPVGFNNTTPIARPTVSGSKGANAALASLMTALAAYGLVTDSTT